MNCTKCGAENAPDSKFCIVCGSPLAEAPAAPEAPVAAAPVEQAAAPEAPVATAPPAAAESGSKFDFGAVKAQLVSTLKPLGEKLKPILSNKMVLAGIAAAVVLLVVIAIVAIVASGNNGYLEMNQNTLALHNGEDISVVIDKKVLSETIESEGTGGSVSSLNGEINAFITDEDDLYVIKGKKFKKVAEDVQSFQLSVSGDGLAYISGEEDDMTLSLYNVKNGKSTTITDEVGSSNYALSPDGKSVCYYTEDDDELELMYFKGSKSIKITSSEARLLGLSDNGKQIYISTENEEEETFLYSYNTKGDKTKLGAISGENVRYNADHTQIMFYNEGKTYISNKGKDAEKASSDRLRMVIAPNAESFYGDYFGITYPVDSLFDHVYLASDGESTSAWLIKKNADKNVKLVSKVSGAKLDASAEYLYYIYDGEELRVIKLSDGDRASERYVTLAEDVDNYVVTSNRKLVYYVSDETLYSVNGKKGGRAKTITNDDVDTALALSGKDVCYYLMDGDLYACSNGKKGAKVATEIETMQSTANGVVYFLSEDALYATSGSKKPTKILDAEF